MILQRLSIVNYRNIGETVLSFSPKINCFIGNNGAGKTNVLDAIYFLSFCRSAQTAIDSQLIRHDAPFFMLEGEYSPLSTLHSPLNIYSGMKRGAKKVFRRDKKAYKRLSEHIGLIPLVLISPSDIQLIEGNSEERRRLMDMVIAQLERPYIESLSRYNKALQQRNAMLKQEDQEPDAEVLSILEEQMAAEGEYIYSRRRAFVQDLLPLFQEFYGRISGGQEQVSLNYVSHCQRGPLLDVIRHDRMKDRAVGYSLHGIHRDDLEILLDGHPMRREGSQGQQKTFVISLKLAQFSFLQRANGHTTPLLLLDDIFDKLDANRVEQIVSLVSGDAFGQIFITDTNRDHLDQILTASGHDYQIFHVNNGCIDV
jgi:DNA replication and repair protein RecF